jgi:hypothetical protein
MNQWNLTPEPPPAPGAEGLSASPHELRLRRIERAALRLYDAGNFFRSAGLQTLALDATSRNPPGGSSDAARRLSSLGCALLNLGDTVPALAKLARSHREASRAERVGPDLQLFTRMSEKGVKLSDHDFLAALDVRIARSKGTDGGGS